MGISISFPLRWAEVGKMLDVDASGGICDYTSVMCAREAERQGLTAQIVGILAMSPTLKGTIGHRVVIADGAYILDVPQTELLVWTEGKDWTHVIAIMSYDIAPEFANLKIPLTRAELSPEWMFQPKGTPTPDWLTGERERMAKELMGIVDNPKSNGGDYPMWTGTYKGMPVRYDTNCESFYYIPKEVLVWTTDVFEPRIIPLTAADLGNAYSVDGRKLLDSITKQLK